MTGADGDSNKVEATQTEAFRAVKIQAKTVTLWKGGPLGILGIDENCLG